MGTWGLRSVRLHITIPQSGGSGGKRGVSEFRVPPPTTTYHSFGSTSNVGEKLGSEGESGEGLRSLDFAAGDFEFTEVKRAA
jgi:hypothetical protein